MQILADQGFPASIGLNASADIRIVRWSEEAVTDVELIEFAPPDFQAVAFVGPAQLWTADVAEAAIRCRVAIIGIIDNSPVDGALLIGQHLTSLARAIKPGARLQVMSREVRDLGRLTT